MLTCALIFAGFLCRALAADNSNFEQLASLFTNLKKHGDARVAMLHEQRLFDLVIPKSEGGWKVLPVEDGMALAVRGLVLAEGNVHVAYGDGCKQRLVEAVQVIALDELESFEKSFPKYMSLLCDFYAENTVLFPKPQSYKDHVKVTKLQGKIIDPVFVGGLAEYGTFVLVQEAVHGDNSVMVDLYKEHLKSIGSPFDQVHHFISTMLQLEKVDNSYLRAWSSVLPDSIFSNFLTMDSIKGRLGALLTILVTLLHDSNLPKIIDAVIKSGQVTSLIKMAFDGNRDALDIIIKKVDPRVIKNELAEIILASGSSNRRKQVSIPNDIAREVLAEVRHGPKVSIPCRYSHLFPKASVNPSATTNQDLFECLPVPVLRKIMAYSVHDIVVDCPSLKLVSKLWHSAGSTRAMIINNGQIYSKLVSDYLNGHLKPRDFGYLAIKELDMLVKMAIDDDNFDVDSVKIVPSVAVDNLVNLAPKPRSLARWLHAWSRNNAGIPLKMPKSYSSDEVYILVSALFGRCKCLDKLVVDRQVAVIVLDSLANASYKEYYHEDMLKAILTISPDAAMTIMLRKCYLGLYPNVDNLPIDIDEEYKRNPQLFIKTFQSDAHLHLVHLMANHKLHSTQNVTPQELYAAAFKSLDTAAQLRAVYDVIVESEEEVDYANCICALLREFI